MNNNVFYRPSEDMSYKNDSVKQQIDERLEAALAWCKQREQERSLTPTPTAPSLHINLLDHRFARAPKIDGI